MKLLITGGAGYIGSHTAHLLVDEGHELVVLDNLYSGHRWAVPEEAEFVQGDVGDPALLERVFARSRFDACLHFAAHIEVGESVENPTKYYRNNTQNALTLFEACRRHDVRHVVFSSTAAVYGEPASSLVSETAPLAPVNPYGASKMMSERILADLAAASSGRLSTVCLRYFNVAGARVDGRIGQATPRATHLIKVAAEVALGLRPSITVFGTDYPTPDGTCLRDYIHVEDLSRAHLDALHYLAKGGASDVFNVGYGRPFSVRDVLETMRKASGRSIRTIDGPRRAGDPTSVAADPAKIKRVLGWTPRYESLELICQTAFDWERTLQERQSRSSESPI